MVLLLVVNNMLLEPKENLGHLLCESINQTLQRGVLILLKEPEKVIIKSMLKHNRSSLGLYKPVYGL